MNLQGIRWSALAAALLVTLGLLLGGSYLVRQRTVDQPLFKLYKGTQEVKDVHIERAPDGLNIQLTLGSVDDLQKTYHRLDEATRALVSDQPYRLAIKDERNPRLEEDFYRLHFGIQEAIATGNFTKLAANLDKDAQTMGLDRYRVFVDSRSVFVQLQGHGGYLYEILPREARPAAAVAMGGAER